MPLGETITVINKSGKIVSTSKHIVDVFKEARSAYRERKAEIKAIRDAEYEERRARKMLKAATLEDDDVRSRASKRSHRTQHHKTHRGPPHSRPPMERGFTDSFYADEPSHRSRGVDQDFDELDIQTRELTRRHTDKLSKALIPRKVTRAKSEPCIDMDLAYGELPPPLPGKRIEDESELRDKMSRLTLLLDEANCLQYSVTAMIESLQKNPDALAAVALTLAEISNLATKLAPGALTALKGSFPAVLALLASPQFMIAAGVGVGITIVALGGFKIIKKIQERKEGEAVGRELEQPLMLEAPPPELSRIELWRRGIADWHAESIGTSVDGGLITPGASNRLIEGALDADDLKSRASRKTTKSKPAKSTTSKKSSKTTKTSHTKTAKDKSSKKKEPSGLRMLFRSTVSHA